MSVSGGVNTANTVNTDPSTQIPYRWHRPAQSAGQPWRGRRFPDAGRRFDLHGHINPANGLHML
ncbi:hypothetical protein D9X30_1867 [Cupriavidus sp. U2]|nr:hypothetical protein D9X30_1867 [Cupriavidus sp. U2]